MSWSGEARVQVSPLHPSLGLWKSMPAQLRATVQRPLNCTVVARRERMATDTVPNVSPGTTPMVSPRRGPVGGRFWRRNATGWGLVLPYVVYFCLFTAFPIGFAIYLTFYRWNNLAA